MLALTRNVGDREQRIFVLGDVDCISNAELLMSRVGMKTSNFSLITGMFRWLSYWGIPDRFVEYTARGYGVGIE